MYRKLIFFLVILFAGSMFDVKGQQPGWDDSYTKWCFEKKGYGVICVQPSGVTALEAQNVTALLRKIESTNQGQENHLLDVKRALEANTTAINVLAAEIKRQNDTYNLELQKLILGRFQNLPSELLNNETFSKELKELMKKVLEDISSAKKPDNDE